ncbi:type IV secretory system conjugative DNA transfer family protein [Xanthobacter agilis]|uniref:type IV secretory system conjugative DNA transfer family protein n=1 Tax=Xanthobacter agilis TaxID=47492 RepID=UPI003726E77C
MIITDMIATAFARAPWILTFGTLAMVAAIVFTFAVPLVVALRSDPRSHGTARWARGRRELKQLLGGPGPVLGRRQGELLMYQGVSPLLTSAPSRSGKGAGSIIPTLLLPDFKRSVIVIDPKGEAARSTWLARQEIGPVYTFDPFGICPGVGDVARINPLHDLAGRVEDAMGLAEALCPDDEAGNSHFTSTARTLLRAILLFVAEQNEGRRNLPEVRRLVTGNSQQVADLLKDMSGHVLRAVCGPANSQLARDPREGASVWSTAGRATEWLDAPAVADALTANDIDFAALKEGNDGPATVYLVVPPDKLAAFSALLRLVTTHVVGSHAKTPTPGRHGSTLLIVDEAAALGRLQALETAVAVMAGYGLQVWLIFQDFAQLRAVYRERGDCIIANCGVAQIFSVTDPETAKTTSDLLGSGTHEYTPEGGGKTKSRQRVARPLLTADEVLREGRIIIRPRGDYPTRATKVEWWRDRQFSARGINERA